MKILVPIFLTGLLSSTESSPFNLISYVNGIISAFLGENENNLNVAPVLTTPKLLTSNGYVPEIHTVVTDDGYILEIHRIPYYKKLLNQRPPTRTILLHHGIFGSSADWVLAGPKKGLAYILSKAYYDVWMANARGNFYSRAHVSKDINSYDFWNFSFHDIGQYDLPAILNYIIDVKGEGVEINYIGFSMGATALFSLLSTKTQYNNVLNAAFALAPIVYTKNMRSPVRLLAKYCKNMENWKKLLGANMFFPNDEIIIWLFKYASELNRGKYESMLAKNIFFILCGYEEEQFSVCLVPSIMDHIPAGTSTKTLIHYAQEVNNGGEFQQFDYGWEGNLKHYGNARPPIYRLENVTVPVALMSADNDWLAANEDVERLFNKLPNPIEHFVVPNKDFNHIDFLFGRDAPSLVFDELLQMLRNHSKSIESF